MSLLIEATIKALDKSIEHYVRLDACTTLVEIALEGIYRDSCELCHVFYVGETCIDCPVQLDTGQQGCQGSPWIELRDALEEEQGPFRYIGGFNYEILEVKPRLKIVIHIELEYLRMLRRRCDETPV